MKLSLRFVICLPGRLAHLASVRKSKGLRSTLLVSRATLSVCVAVRILMPLSCYQLPQTLAALSGQGLKPRPFQPAAAEWQASTKIITNSPASTSRNQRDNSPNDIQCWRNLLAMKPKPRPCLTGRCKRCRRCLCNRDLNRNDNQVFGTRRAQLVRVWNLFEQSRVRLSPGQHIQHRPQMRFRSIVFSDALLSCLHFLNRHVLRCHCAPVRQRHRVIRNQRHADHFLILALCRQARGQVVRTCRASLAA